MESLKDRESSECLSSQETVRLIMWCAQRDLNPHGRPLDPKSSASANSAMRANLLIILKMASDKMPHSFGDPTGTRTRVTAVKGRCLNRLTIGPYLLSCAS